MAFVLMTLTNYKGRIAMRATLRLLLLLALIAVSLSAPSSITTSTARIDEPEMGLASKTGLVVSTSSIASDAGASVLHQGGNAVDAAVATAFALAVTHPSAGNIGGGGFMVIRRASGEAVTIDYREKAPLQATRTMYLDAEGKIDRRLTAAGYLAPGVPGTVRGLELAHKKFGKLSWKEVVMPAVKLAEEGFIISESLARGLNWELEGALGRYPASVAAYGKPDGSKWAAGDRLLLKDLGKTLRAIATDGPDVFYKGWIADLIAADMQANGGLITKADLAAYQAKQRAPLKGTFRSYEIISMPPPSSGGVALIEMLNILEHFDLKQHGRFAPDTLHLMIEAMRRAYLDRARHLGDPDFVTVPVARLTSKEYAKTLAASISRDKAASSIELGKDIVTMIEQPESEETTHFSVIDKDGMAVANTYTLEGGYGSKVVVKGAGFLLNNEMGDFNKKPGETNLRGDIGTPANLIAPGKRMLSSMTPTIVTRQGRVVLVTGSPGGRTIINTVLSIVLGVTEFGMHGRQAVDAARLHHQWLPDSTTLEEGAISAETLARLQQMGHNITLRGRQGDGHSIFIDPQSRTAYGVNDKRSADSKASK
jgi:gamma-glutamyltranspeptidase/glutathione hydrolase